MGYKQPNNPMKMMKSALKMHKAEKKAGMHRDSAMYMNSPMYSGHSPMERESRELKDMPIVDIEKGDAKGSPAKMNHSEGTPANHYFDPMHKQHKDDHKPKKKGSPAKNMDHDKMEGKEKHDHMMVHHPAKPPKGSPAKAAKPDYIDIDGDGDKNESMKEAAKDKKKGSPAKKFDRVVFGGNKGDKSKTKPGKKDFEKKGSPAKKYDKVVLGGNKGDKSKTKPGKKDYEK